MSGPGTVPTAILREGQVGPELSGVAGEFLAFASDGRHVEGVPAPSGTLTPLSRWLVVDPANAGTESGAFSGNAAFATVTAAVAALPVGGGAIALVQGDYSAESPIATAEPVTYQGTTGNVALPPLHPSADMTLRDIDDQTTIAPTADITVTLKSANVVISGASNGTIQATDTTVGQTGATGIDNLLMDGGQIIGPLTATEQIACNGTKLSSGLVTAQSFDLQGCEVGVAITSTAGMQLIGCNVGAFVVTCGGDLTIDRDTYETAIANGATFTVTGGIHVLAPTNDYKVGPTNVPAGTANAVIGSVALALIGKNISPGGGSLALLANVLCPTAGYTTGFWLMATLRNDGAGGWTADDTNFTPINPALAGLVTNLEFHVNGANLEVRATTDAGGPDLAFIGHIQALGPS